MKELLIYGELLILFFPSVLSDCRKKVIRPYWSLIAGVILTVLNLLLDLVTVKEMITGLLIGLLFFLPPLLRPGSLGSGDSILLAVSGAVSGIGRLLLLLLVSFPTAGAAGFLFLLIRRKDRYEVYLPFIPFLFGAALLLGVLSLFFPGGTT